MELIVLVGKVWTMHVLNDGFGYYEGETFGKYTSSGLKQ